MKALRPKPYDEKLVFSDGSYILTDHNQDCCEYNFADWSSLDDTGFWETNFKSIEVKPWEYGFLINGFSVNCYSEQNGYYSSDLEVYYFSHKNKLISSFNIDCEEIE
jgi:hypothetical protein